MNNCLVTKLKAVVENNDLPLLGEFQIKMNAIPSFLVNQTLYLQFNVDSEIYTADGTKFVDDQGNPTSDTVSFTANVGKYVFLPTSAITICVKNKYNITDIRCNFARTEPFDVSNLKYSSNITRIDAKLYGDIADLNGLTSLTRLHLSNVPEYYNLDKVLIGNIGAINTLRSLTFLTIAFSKLNGNLEDIGALTSLTNLQVGNSGIGGSVEAFVDSQRTQATSPRTTCSNMSVAYIGQQTSITYQGVQATTSGSAKLSWAATGEPTLT